MRREQPRANDASRSSRSAWRTPARTGGLEPPPPGFVVRHIVQFCYVREMERPTGFEPAFPSLRGWCPALDDDRELAPAAGFEPASFSVNSRARSPRVLDRKNWWRQSVTLRPRRSCKDHLHPCAVPVVPRVGFEPTSPRLQRGAFTRLASSANWSGRWEIEPIVPTLATWCSAIELRPRDWWAGTESNGHRLCGAFTAPWARQCPACPNWLRERDSNTRFVVMSHVRGLVTAPSSRVEGARL